MNRLDDALVRGSHDLALSVYREAGEQGGNLFFSPYGISSAIALAYAGARGETRRQMSSVMRLPWDEEQAQAHFGALTERVARGGNSRLYELAIASALWGAKGIGFRSEFRESIKGAYGGKVDELDFAGDAEGSRRTINEWLANQTNNRIRDLISKGTVGPETLLVLATAVYFKAAWAKKFNERKTRISDFIMTNQQGVSVPLMRQTGEFRYAEHSDFQVVEMQYFPDDWGMVVLLPRDSDGLARVENSLTAEKLASTFSSLTPRTVTVEFPRFELTESIDLGRLLSAIGMLGAFSHNADFSGIAEKQDLFISSAVHKAFVGLNEWGTEATAATSVIMLGAASNRSEPVVFRADHPFLFIIRHRATNVILFIGRLVNPG